MKVVSRAVGHTRLGADLGAGERHLPNREPKQLPSRGVSFLQNLCPLDIHGRGLSSQRLVEMVMTPV